MDMSETDAILLAPDKRPRWLQYPRSFCRVVEQRLLHLTPWHILTGEQALNRCKGLTLRFPARELFPFAYRQDNDDVACWTSGLGEKVIIIHDFASVGWEGEGGFDDFWAWFRAAVQETVEWE